MMKTEDLIVQLARAATPVTLVPRPSIRLARWASATAAVLVLAVFIIGPRRDVATAITQATFLLMATITIAVALLAAASALVLSIPGAERSAWPRGLPLMAGGVWVAALTYLLTLEGAALDRLAQWPVHQLCVIEITGLSLLPGWALFRMLRHAAPLDLAWSAAFATLAAAAFAAAATQFLCPIDDQAHQLVGHVVPVAVLSVLGTIAGRRALDWTNRAGR